MVPWRRDPSAQHTFDSVVLVKPVGDPKLTLAQKLAAFDPAQHGGEAMAATSRIGHDSSVESRGRRSSLR
jgi:hypothetical protein